jgi:hypothetical protein
MKSLQREVFVHVGLQRAGSTFLQENVFPNMDLNFCGNDLLKSKIKDGKNLISNESLCGYYFALDDLNNGYEIANRISSLFPNTKIIFIVRQFDDWIKSCYAKYMNVLHRRYDGLSFVEWSKKFNVEKVDFNAYTGYLKSLFDDVLVLNYELLRDNPDLFIKYLCDWMDIKVPKYKLEYKNVDFGNNKFVLYKGVNYLYKVLKGLC